MTEPINLNQMPLTLQTIHEILHLLCTDGEVHVVGAQVDPVLPARLFALMSARLREEDKEWLRAAIREEVSAVTLCLPNS